MPLVARLTAATGTMLLLAAVLCRLCNSSRQPQQPGFDGDQALLREIESQPADQVLLRLATGDSSIAKLAVQLTQPAKQHLVQRLFNGSSRKMQTLQTGIDLCWSLAGVSCVCAHLENKSAGGEAVRDFRCARGVRSGRDCGGGGGGTGGCAQCSAEFKQAGRDCFGPDCAATCQCRCPGASWPSQIRPCSSWCSPTRGGPCSPGAVAAQQTRAASEVAADSLTSNRLWNGVLVCAFLLICLIVAAYGCRLCTHCSKLCSGVAQAFASLRTRLGLDFGESNLRIGVALSYDRARGAVGGAGAHNDYLADFDDTEDYDSSEGGGSGGGAGRHGRRRRRRDRRGRERTGSFLSLSCAESINVVSPTDLILPSYREQAPPPGPFSAAPPSYEQAQQEQQQDLQNPPPAYSELFEPGGSS